jgi:hypothetical protein
MLIDIHIKTRVERKKYEEWRPTAIRGKVRAWNGDVPSERIRERLTEESHQRFLKRWEER